MTSPCGTCRGADEEEGEGKESYPEQYRLMNSFSLDQLIGAIAFS